MAQYLWGLNSSATTGGITPNVIALPPMAAPGKQASNFTAPGKQPQTNLINVVRDFYWTYSPVGDTARAETPRIILTERKLRTNSLIAQLKYALGQTYSGGAQTIENIKYINNSLKLTDFLKSLVYGVANADLTDLYGPQEAAAYKQSANDFLDKVVKGAEGIPASADAAKKQISDYINNSVTGAKVKDVLDTTFADDRNPTVNSSPWLSPYKNLYLTDPTGWVYVLPYFNNSYANQGNSFLDSAGDSTGSPFIQGPIANAAAGITGVAGILASLNSPAQITFIEKAKYYNYPTEGEDITVEFPLINTGQVTYDDVVKNWQFLYLLLYQNRPGKTSANTVDQPVIYQVEVPGAKFFPYCFIQSINIEFMGSRREMNINIPISDNVSSDLGDVGQSLNSSTNYQTFPAIIPDAYRVTISLKSMLANSKNFMQHMIESHNLVQTGVDNTAALLNAPGGLPAAAAAANPIFAATNPIATNFGLGFESPSINTAYPNTGLGPLAN